MVKYKDKCDKCGKFDYLKGKNGKCLCVNCIKEIEPKKINLKTIETVEIQLSMFDLEKNDKIQDTFTLFTIK